MANESVLCCRVSEEYHQRFTAWAQEGGLSASGLLAELVRACVEGKRPLGLVVQLGRIEGLESSAPTLLQIGKGIRDGLEGLQEISQSLAKVPQVLTSVMEDLAAYADDCDVFVKKAEIARKQHEEMTQGVQRTMWRRKKTERRSKN